MMNFATRFSETRLEHEGSCVRLRGRADEILLELRGLELDDAERAGFIDRNNLHFSMFEYARMRTTLPPIVPQSTSPRTTSRTSNDFDRSFLSDLRICWE
jgi:hypothetical protein